MMQPCPHPTPMAAPMRRAVMALSALAALMLALLPGPVRAERSHAQDGYTVHYNAIPSTVLSPEVARRYGITRSGGRGLINIAVLRDGADAALPQAVRATVSAHVRSLTGQRNPIELREIVEQDAIYYIGDFRVRGEELLRFELDVTPAGARRPIPVRFEQGFVGD